MTILRFFMLLALVIWVGGIIFFSFVVAPALFSVLPTRNLAGLVVTRALGALHWIGIVCGGVFLICSVLDAHASTGSWQATAARNVLVFGMVAVTLVSQSVVGARMAALRAAMGEIDSIPLTDPRRIAFNQLHRWSTGLETAVLILGLAAIYAMARHWGIPILNSGSARPVSSRV
jgi:uncharacterized membrane protein